MRRASSSSADTSLQPISDSLSMMCLLPCPCLACQGQEQSLKTGSLESRSLSAPAVRAPPEHVIL